MNCLYDAAEALSQRSLWSGLVLKYGSGSSSVADCCKHSAGISPVVSFNRWKYSGLVLVWALTLRANYIKFNYKKVVLVLAECKLRSSVSSSLTGVGGSDSCPGPHPLLPANGEVFVCLCVFILCISNEPRTHNLRTEPWWSRVKGYGTACSPFPHPDPYNDSQKHQLPPAVQRSSDKHTSHTSFLPTCIQSF